MDSIKDFNNKYKKGEEIGSGEFSTIYKGFLKNSNEPRALKMIDKNKIKYLYKQKYLNDPDEEVMKNYINCFLNEINNNKIAEGENKNNKNAVKYYEYYDTKEHFIIVMELCDEDMLTYLIQNQKDLNNIQKYEIINQINNTLKIMIEKGVTNLDLKLDNILLKYDNKEKTKFTIKLKIPSTNQIKMDLRKFNNTQIKSYNCLYSPEILSDGEYNEKCDLWTLGIIIYVIYFKDYPFNGVNESEILEQITDDNIKNKIKNTEDSKLIDLIQGLLTVEPQKRLSWKEYFNHPFFSEKKSNNFRVYYQIEEQPIGTTSIASVYKAKCKNNGEIRAIKVFNKDKVRENYRRDNLDEISDEEMQIYVKEFFNEIEHMKIFNENKENNNIVKFYEYYQNDKEIAIVMELCDNNLLNIFSNKKEPFDSEKIYDILFQLNNSFKIMVQNKLIHRALNLENILIKNKNEEKTNYIIKLKLTEDSVFLKDLNYNYSFNKSKANLKFIAPEILRGDEYNEKCDLWSLGVIIYVLYFKKFPFNGNSENQLLQAILNHRDQLIIKTDNEALDNLIRGLLNPDPSQRYDWNQYFNASFFRLREDFRKYYEIEKQVGNAKYAVVYRGRDRKTKELRAIKVFNKKGIREEHMRNDLIEINDLEMKTYTDYFFNEIKHMKMIGKIRNRENPYTVKFIEYFNTKDEFAIVSEYCDENLLTLFANKKLGFNSQKIRDILSLLNNSFRIMAQNKIIHRALTLENILVKYENTEKNKYIVKLKLTDDSILLSDLKNNLSFKKTKVNLKFIAPEILREEEYNEKCDLWSLGVIIFIFYFRQYPFNGKNESEIKNDIEKNVDKLVIKTDDKALDDLIKGLLNPNPNKRLSWDQYFNHYFFVKRINQNFRIFYEIKQQIGTAGYAVVYKAIDKQNKELRAIKVFEKNRVRDDFRRENLREINNEEMKPYIDGFFNEINHMKLFIDSNKNEQNDNIVKFYEYFHTNDEIAVVMELCDDNLLNIVGKKKKTFNTLEIFNILNQLNNSFRIMSKNKLIHRSLNLENILVKYENEEKTKYIYKLKLTEDSILLKDLNNNFSFNKDKANPKFIAPEILRGEEYNEKCDLWSLGVIIYVLLFRKFPFVGKNEFDVAKNISSFRENLQIKAQNKDLDNLINGLLNTNPFRRLSWEQYFNHSFFKKDNYYN